MSFGKSIDETFKNDIDKYLKCRQKFAILRHKAILGKGKTLSDEEAAELAKLKYLIRKLGKLPPKIFDLKIRLNGKSVRVSKKILKYMLSQQGFKFINHGRHSNQNKTDHWSNFYMPKYNKAKELYCKYKNLNLEQTQDIIMTKTEKENLKKECEQGLHGFPYEFLVKNIEKKERRAVKTQERRIKRVAQKTLIEEQTKIAKLEQELAQAKAEIARLKQLKDLNSDIPNENLNENLTETELNQLKEYAAAWIRINQDPLACEQHYNEVLSRMPQSEDNSADNIEITPVMQDQLNQIYQIESNNTNTIPEFVKNGDDIPEAEPEQVVDNSDIPEEEPPHPSKVLPKLAEFVKKCYIGPSTATRISELYGEKQIFKQPRVQCDMISAIQQNAKYRYDILKTVQKELTGKISNKDKQYLEYEIGKINNELKQQNNRD